MAFSHGRSKLHTNSNANGVHVLGLPPLSSTNFSHGTFWSEVAPSHHTLPAGIPEASTYKKKKKKKKARKFFAACVLCCPEPAFSSCVMSGVLRRLILCVWTSEQELKQDEEVDVFCWHRIARRCMIEQIQGYIPDFWIQTGWDLLLEGFKYALSWAINLDVEIGKICQIVVCVGGESGTFKGL